MLTRRHFITFMVLGGLASRVARKILGTRDARPAMFWKKTGVRIQRENRNP